MNLTEKYRPKKIDDFLGDKDKIREAESYVRSRFPVILCGKSGIGKTSLAYVLSDIFGYTLCESNMSDERKKNDLESLSAKLRTNSFTPTLFLLDEIDGIKNQDKLLDILKGSVNPVIMTANDKYRLSSKLIRFCKLIEMFPPPIGEIAKHMKHIADCEGIKNISFEGISGDVRSSINTVFSNGSKLEDDTNDFLKTEMAFKENIVSDIDPVWLLDNVHNFSFGLDVFDNLKIISYMAETNDPIFISTLKKAEYGKSKYPNYFRKR